MSIESIYDNIEAWQMPNDLQSWPSYHSPVFEQLIRETQPKVIIEVGSWKGGSAIRMAELTQELGTTIYCVDTWLGSIEHLMQENRPYEFPVLNGHPMLYWQFLTNVKASGFHNRIIPMPNTSLANAAFLYQKGIRADLIYIDGDHTAHGCYMDVAAYRKLLRDPAKSLIFGDDYFVFPDVKKAIDRHVDEKAFKLELQDPMWIGRPLEAV